MGPAGGRPPPLAVTPARPAACPPPPQLNGTAGPNADRGTENRSRCVIDFIVPLRSRNLPPFGRGMKRTGEDVIVRTMEERTLDKRTLVEVGIIDTALERARFLHHIYIPSLSFFRTHTTTTTPHGIV